MRKLSIMVVVALVGAASSAANAFQDDARAALVARNTHPFSMGEDGLSGPGYDFLIARTETTQFVLIGEPHNDYLTPVFTGHLFDTLHAERGFDFYAVEQDPYAVEALLNRAGNADALDAYVREHPYQFTFRSDQDIDLIADVAGLGPVNGSPRVWGLEQAFGGQEQLRELAAMAPDEAFRETVSGLHRAAVSHALRRENFLHDVPDLLPALQDLRDRYGATLPERGRWLLDHLILSAEIYSYNRRAGEGEPVGLYNNTVREAEMRRLFLENYRSAEADLDELPRVLFKMGGWHTMRGRNRGGSWTLGSLVHELAYLNGTEAYGISILAWRGETREDGWPAWMADWVEVLLPEQAPDSPVVIDLAPMRVFYGALAQRVAEENRGQFYDLLFSWDAIVVLPGSREADFTRLEDFIARMESAN